MKLKYILLFVAFLLIGSVAQAQPVDVVGTERVGFTMNMPTLAEVQSLRYRVYVDGVRPPVGVAATCAGTVAPFSCEVPIPTMTVGTHNLSLTAIRVLDGVEVPTTESGQSSPPLAVNMLPNAGVPSTPTGLRIIRIP